MQHQQILYCLPLFHKLNQTRVILQGDLLELQLLQQLPQDPQDMCDIPIHDSPGMEPGCDNTQGFRRGDC